MEKEEFTFTSKKYDYLYSRPTVQVRYSVVTLNDQQNPHTKNLAVCLKKFHFPQNIAEIQTDGYTYRRTYSVTSLLD